jgi:hypothetical protein
MGSGGFGMGSSWGIGGCEEFRAVSLLMWSGEFGGVPFSLRENGHECLASL